MKREYFNFKGTKITRHDAKIISLLVQQKEYPEICDTLNITRNTLSKELGTIFLKTRSSCARTLLPAAIKEGFTDKGYFKDISLFPLLLWVLDSISDITGIAEFFT